MTKLFTTTYHALLGWLTGWAAWGALLTFAMAGWVTVETAITFELLIYWLAARTIIIKLEGAEA